MNYTNSAYVYVIGSVSDGLYKIGVSRNPVIRLKHIQASNPMPLALVAIRYSDKPFAEERRLHADLGAYRRKGEWFKLIPEQVSAIFKPYELTEGLHDANPRSEPRRRTREENLREDDCELELSYDTARQMLRDLKASIAR